MPSPLTLKASTYKLWIKDDSKLRELLLIQWQKGSADCLAHFVSTQSSIAAKQPQWAETLQQPLRPVTQKLLARTTLRQAKQVLKRQFTAHTVLLSGTFLLSPFSFLTSLPPVRGKFTNSTLSLTMMLFKHQDKASASLASLWAQFRR